MIVVLVSCKDLGFILAVMLGQITGELVPVSQKVAPRPVPLSGAPKRHILSQPSCSASVDPKIQIITPAEIFVSYGLGRSYAYRAQAFRFGNMWHSVCTLSYSSPRQRP